jgi:hypothetical protein
MRIKNEELANVDGLLDVDDKMASIDHKLKPTVQSDEGMKKISSALKELLESKNLPEFK